MPHFPKPFFKKARGVWYVEIDRKQHNLGPDKDEAFRKYHQLMGQPHEQKISSESMAVWSKYSNERKALWQFGFSDVTKPKSRTR